MDGLFKGRHFDQEIIVLCVRWYLRAGRYAEFA
jgi:transposase-like protein